MINIIAAMSPNRAIGCANKLPWRIHEDMKSFKHLTTGNVVIMGRKTFESLGKALPNRVNIVITRSSFDAPNIIVCSSIDEALAKAKIYGKEIFIIGGASVYEQTIPLSDRMYLSHVKKDYDGDAFFPQYDESKWKVVERTDFPDFELVVYSR